MKILIFCITFLSCLSVFSQKKEECLAFKTGDYYILKGTDTCFVTRTENRQFEYCQSSSDTKLELIVVWLSDCKYILRDIHYNPSTKPMTMKNDIVMTILETSADNYLVHAKLKGQPKLITTVYRRK